MTKDSIDPPLQPLIYLKGKPVFPGDTLEHNGTSYQFYSLSSDSLRLITKDRYTVPVSILKWPKLPRPSKLLTPAPMAHVHRDLIIEWANGAMIQNFNGIDWITCDNLITPPCWYPESKYRIKPISNYIRLVLLKDGSVNQFIRNSKDACNETDEWSLVDLNFDRWLTEWIEY